MNKYIEVLCIQNPIIDLKCMICGELSKFKSKDVFRENIYNFICPKCKATGTYDTEPFVKEFIKGMKSLNAEPNI